MASRPAVYLRYPSVVVCAWCRRNDHTQARVRPAGARRWEAVSHEYARVLAQSGLASHGLCPACQPLAVRDRAEPAPPRVRRAVAPST